MTTIVWDGKTLASDSQQTQSPVICSLNQQKIFDCGEARASATGLQVDCLAFVAAVRLGEQECFEPQGKDFHGLLLTASGRLLEYHSFKGEALGDALVVDYPYAWGSGAPFAIAALDFGKSAVEAVKYAMTRDVFTGGKIQKATV